MTQPFIEWKSLPRSIRHETEHFALDVWPYACESGLVRTRYRYTVYDKLRKSYIDNGNTITQDEACERAMRAAGI